jgi:hypothetical protein
MYDLDEDPYALENLAHPRYNDPAVVTERERLAAKLARIEDELARPVASPRPAVTAPRRGRTCAHGFLEKVR